MFLKFTFSKIVKVCIFISIFIAQTMMAQGSSTIRGVVYDKTAKEELPGANIVVKGTSIGAASDLDGKYLLRNVPSGKQTIVVSYIGYISVSVVVDITDREPLNKDFYLVATTIQGKEIIVTAQALGQASAIQQQLTSDKIVNIVSEARIQQLPDFNAAEAIGRLPGVSTLSSSGEANKIVIRGLAPQYRACVIIQFF